MCVRVRVHTCTGTHLTMCGTGIGAGAMGPGVQAVVLMVLDCQLVPPVSFFSPCWVHCMSGLNAGAPNNKMHHAKQEAR